MARQSRTHLARQILDMVRDGGFEPGSRLREQQFGDLLRVSRTPVRGALAILAERGVVESRRNVGYVLLRRPLADDWAALDLSAGVGADLYARIVADRLAGAIPSSVTQVDLARRYGVDRAVLLKTLSRLAEDGLVARNRGRGWSFLPTLDTGVALQNSYDFRLTVEPAAFLLPSFRPDRAALERSRLQHVALESHADIGSVDRRALFESDAAFHEMFAEFSRNAFFLQAVQQQNRLRRLLEFSGDLNRRRVRDWCREHLAIIEAVRIGELMRAADCMRLHLTQAYRAAPAIGSERRFPDPLPTT